MSSGSWSAMVTWILKAKVTGRIGSRKAFDVGANGSLSSTYCTRQVCVSSAIATDDRLARCLRSPGTTLDETSRLVKETSEHGRASCRLSHVLSRGRENAAEERRRAAQYGKARSRAKWPMRRLFSLIAVTAQKLCGNRDSNRTQGQRNALEAPVFS